MATTSPLVHLTSIALVKQVVGTFRLLKFVGNVDLDVLTEDARNDLAIAQVCGYITTAEYNLGNDAIDATLAGRPFHL